MPSLPIPVPHFHAMACFMEATSLLSLLIVNFHSGKHGACPRPVEPVEKVIPEVAPYFVENPHHGLFSLRIACVGGRAFPETINNSLRRLCRH